MAHRQDSHSIQEEMVAYLDGELNADQMQQVEDRLARDPPYRRQLQRLQRTWECLDQLPRSHVEEQFARSTVEMVAVQAERETASKPAATPTRRRSIPVVIVVVAATAAWVGLIATRKIRFQMDDGTPPAAGEADPAQGGTNVAPEPTTAERAAHDLAPEDTPVLRQWVIRYLVNSPTARRLQARLSRSPGHLSARDQRDPARASRSQRPVRKIFHLMVDPRADAAFRSLVDAQSLNDLRQQLSPPSRAALNEAGGLAQQQDKVRNWIRAMLREHLRQSNDAWPALDVSHQELERFFAEDLSRDQRVRLMAMPRAEMLQQLKRIYRTKRGPPRRGPLRDP